MASDETEEISPIAHRNHTTDAYVTKFVDRLDARTARRNTEKSKEPPGGYDETPIPRASPGYTVKFTFHKATDLPFADIATLSSDPYILVQLSSSLQTRHKQDPRMRLRTPTIRRNVNPVWDCEWIVANVPGNGFQLKARIYDEDPADHDDRLGNVTFHVDRIDEAWEGIKEGQYSIKKRMGSKRAYIFRACAAMINPDVHMSGKLYISVQVLGRTEDEHGGRMYTIGPCHWSQHYSPMIGMLAGTKDPEKVEGGKRRAERYNFQANQIQLQGPVPEKLYHRYVEFKPFVAGMFNSKSLRGRILNRALHHQHARIYNYDRTTVYGLFPSPCKDMTRKFLDFVHHDAGGRIYTYVITLDGLWRFTETGKEFGIDLLSKHTMHSDVSIYIAFSGEFFIRRLKTPWKDPSEQTTHPPDEISGGPPDQDPPKSPAYYQLVIDNDSGTYRPNKDLLPTLQDFMQHNLPGLKVTTLDCMGDKEKMDKMKSEQRERRKAEGNSRVYAQADDSSISSSDESDLEDTANHKPRGRFSTLAHPKDMVLQWAQGTGDSDGEGASNEKNSAGPSTATNGDVSHTTGLSNGEESKQDSKSKDHVSTARSDAAV